KRWPTAAWCWAAPRAAAGSRSRSCCRARLRRAWWRPRRLRRARPRRWCSGVNAPGWTTTNCSCATPRSRFRPTRATARSTWPRPCRYCATSCAWRYWDCRTPRRPRRRRPTATFRPATPSWRDSSPSWPTPWTRSTSTRAARRSRRCASCAGSSCAPRSTTATCACCAGCWPTPSGWPAWPRSATPDPAGPRACAYRGRGFWARLAAVPALNWNPSLSVSSAGSRLPWLVLLLWLALVAPARADGGVLVLGRISDDPASHYNQLKPLLDYVVPRMADVGIREGRVLMARDAQQMQSYMRRGRVDWVTETAATAMNLAERSGAQPLLMTERDGVSSYRTLFFVRADSPVRELADLRGRSIAFQNPLSTSSYYVPATELLDAGLRLEVLLSPMDRPA